MAEKNLRIGLLCDFYGKLLTEKQLAAITMYYDDDLSLAEIAQHTKITRQGVRDAIKRGEAILLEFEEKLGLAERFERLSEEGQRIKQCAEDILAHSSRGAVNTEIMSLAQEIISLTEHIED